MIPAEAQPSVPSMNPVCSPKITAEMKHLLSLVFLCLSVSLGHFNYTTVSCIYIPENQRVENRTTLLHYIAVSKNSQAQFQYIPRPYH